MSQKTVFECDACKKVIGAKMHISMSLSQGSGIAVPPQSEWNTSNSWRVQSINGFMHFHDVACLSKFFTSKINSLTKPK